MKANRFMISAALAMAALGAAGTAAASDVFWSVGVHAAPGVNVRVGNAPAPRVVVAQPYYQPARVYQQAPVYVRPAPVYYQPPPPVYYQPRPVYQSRPVFYSPAPVVVYRGHGNPHYRGNQGYHRGRDHRR